MAHLCQIKAQVKKSMRKLIIFDLDGTLLDTMEDITNAVNHALKSCGCRTIGIEECRKLVGHGIRNLLRDALPIEFKTEEMLENMSRHFYPYYNEHISDCTKPYPGIVELLQDLSAEGHHLAIASNKFQAGTEELAEKFFGDIRFVKVLGQREGYPIKPDAGVVFEVMQAVPEIGLEDVLYCGDSDVDMQTGINAGVKTIAVTWGFRPKEVLEGYSPWMITGEVAEISEVLIKKR